MPRTTIRAADHYTADQLSALFTRVYAGYFVPVRLDAASFRSMVETFDIDLAASRVVALGRKLVAIALLGIREKRGWIGGMGVAPEQRGHRLGWTVMQAVLDAAHERQLRSVDLELITENAPAIHVYDQLGFRRRRTLEVWNRHADSTFPLPPRRDIQPLDVADCLAAFDDLHTVTPPWQRDLPSLQRMATSLSGLGILEGGQLSAYVLYRMRGAQVEALDAAAAPGQRTKAIEAVFRGLIRHRSGSPLRFNNLSHDDPVSEAMHQLGADVELRQYEMTLDL